MAQPGLLFNDRFSVMPWDAVDAVVFDIGNVLMRYDPAYLLRAMVEDPQRQEVLMERVFHSPYWLELDRGTLSYADAPRRMAQGDERLEKEIAYVLENWCDYKAPMPQGWAAAQACAAHGKRLCLLSNYHREAFAYNLAHHEIFRLFDVRLISCYVHQLKPEPEIYDTLVHVAGLEPVRTLFLDDTLGNVQGAMKAGLHGYWVRSEEEMDAFFSS